MDMSRYLGLFLDEARDHLEAARGRLTGLHGSDRSEALRRLFHHAHSLKGMSATMGVTPLVDLSHAMEDLLERLRERPAADAGAGAALLQRSLACAERMLVRLERSGSAEDAEVPELVRDLGALAASAADGPLAPAGPSAEPIPEPNASASEPGERRFRVELELETTPSRRARDTACQIAGLGELGRLERMISPPLGTEDGGAPRLAFVLRTPLDEEELRARLACRPGLTSMSVSPAGLARAAPPARPATWVRVRADLLDAVLESTVALLLDHARSGDGGPTSRDRDRRESLLRRLHGDLMELRLLPFDSVCERLTRGVRDLATSQGKRVALEIQGRTVRLDRSVLDRLVDPLMHVLRNAVDHGLEPPAQRSRGAKPETGRLVMRLDRRGDRATITVEDDGRGLRPEVLRRAAVERGLLTADAAARLDDREALGLIARPGFSTAAAVSEVSGRGVGLDFVRDRVESMGGRFEVEATPGRGTCIRLSIPLTLALVQALIVRCAGDLFAVPVGAVARAVDLTSSATERVGGKHVLALDDERIELVRVAERLRLRSASDERPSWALLLDTDHGRRGLAVDEVLGRRDLVVRPLGAPLDRLRELSGAALMDDGSLALVLDPLQLAR